MGRKKKKKTANKPLPPPLPTAHQSTNTERVSQVGKMRSLRTVYNTGEFSDELRGSARTEAHPVVSAGSGKQILSYDEVLKRPLSSEGVKSSYHSYSPKTKPRPKPTSPPANNSQAMTHCPICGVRVRADRLDKHLCQAHHKQVISSSQILPATHDAAPEPSLHKEAVSTQSMIRCSICNARIRVDRQERHMRKAHGETINLTPQPLLIEKDVVVIAALPNGTVPKKPTLVCPNCNIPVRADRLEQHLRKVHSNSEQK